MKDLKEIKEYFYKLNYNLDEDILKSFYAAIMTRPRFVILSGPPGTGKTSFALLFAYAWHMAEDGGSGEESKGDMGVVVDINGEKYGIFRYWISSDLRPIRTNNYLVIFEGESTVRCFDLNTNKFYSRDLSEFGITFNFNSTIAIVTYDERYLFIGQRSYDEYEFVVLKLEDLQFVKKFGKLSLSWMELYNILSFKTFDDLISDLGGFERYSLLLDRYLIVWGDKTGIYDMKEGKIILEINGEEVYGSLSLNKRYLVLEFKEKSRMELKVIDLEKEIEIFSDNDIIEEASYYNKKNAYGILHDKYLVVPKRNYVRIYDLEKNEDISIIAIDDGKIEIYELKYPFLGISQEKSNKTIIYDLEKREKYNLEGKIAE